MPCRFACLLAAAVMLPLALAAAPKSSSRRSSRSDQRRSTTTAPRPTPKPAAKKSTGTPELPKKEPIQDGRIRILGDGYELAERMKKTTVPLAGSVRTDLSILCSLLNHRMDQDRRITTKFRFVCPHYLRNVPVSSYLGTSQSLKSYYDICREITGHGGIDCWISGDAIVFFTVDEKAPELSPEEKVLTAAVMGRTEELQAYLAAGGNPNLSAPRSGFTLLQLAIRGPIINPGDGYHRGPLPEREKPVKMLLEAGADPNLADAAGETALNAASRRGAAMTRLLLRYRADPAKGDPITGFVYADDAESIKLLIEHGVNPKELGPAVHQAITCPKALKALLEAGAPTDHIDSFGRTPLISATRAWRFTEAKLLLEAGADPAVKDKEGKTALDYAPTKELRKLLRDAGAE